MKFILLTMGGDDWHTAVTAAKQQLNVYLEISGSLDSDKIAHAAANLTPRKVVYGSGIPFRDPHLTLGLIADTPSLTNFDRNRILAENGQSLFFPQVATE
jgi:predicted TIM-barrel fold metal-dependent hydrolase